VQMCQLIYRAQYGSCYARLLITYVFPDALIWVQPLLTTAYVVVVPSRPHARQPNSKLNLH
jgi:hypothetical protein